MSEKLIAEQVRKAIFISSTYTTYDGTKYYASGIDMQAIADELNATLGGRECDAIFDKDYYRGINGVCESLKCSNCDEPLASKFRHCPWCGARIRKAMKQ